VRGRKEYGYLVTDRSGGAFMRKISVEPCEESACAPFGVNV
jgi:hypothetical protein